MTDKEKAVVMAHTGICMLTGEKFSIYHKYIEELMGRPVFTHELANAETVNQIKEKSKEDFLKLCKDEFVPESCEDCISRADAINQCGFGMTSLLIADNLRKLPPVTPKPKIGHWKKMISVYDMIEGKYKMIPYTHQDEELSNPPFYVCDCGNNSKKPTNYCPDCGAKMVEPQAESEEIK